MMDEGYGALHEVTALNLATQALAAVKSATSSTRQVR
jgi:hypothetical protein